MSGRAVAATALGVVAIAVLMRWLPRGVFAATQGALLVAASLVMLLVALAVVLRPARALAQRIFALPIRVDGPVLGMPRQSEMRAVLRPLLVAAVCFLVAALGGFLRGP